MKLIELLSVCSENTMITVWSNDDRFIAEYDGKDSIDEAYNDCNVLGISGRSGSKYEAIDVMVEVK